MTPISSAPTTTHTRNALKEWATVLRAMARGEQIILFRKGGIIEQHDRFEVEHPKFFLYPTYFHQYTDQLQERYQPWISETESEKPDAKHVRVTLYGTVDHVMEAKNVERLRELTNAFIWTPDYVEKTFAWKPEKPAYLLFIRAYHLAEPQMIQEAPEYGGCVSWISLNDSLPVGEMTPVLTDAAFAARCEEIQSRLAGTMTPVTNAWTQSNLSLP